MTFEQYAFDFLKPFVPPIIILLAIIGGKFSYDKLFGKTYKDKEKRRETDQMANYLLGLKEADSKTIQSLTEAIRYQGDEFHKAILEQTKFLSNGINGTNSRIDSLINIYEREKEQRVRGK